MSASNMEPNRRILVVDDNEAIHVDFRKILAGPVQDNSLADDEAALFGSAAVSSGVSTQPYPLDSAFQGQEALVKVQAAVEAGKPYALAFLDVRMPPGWDGVETIPHLWSADPALHIVICSAYSDHTWDQLIAKLGLSDRLLILKKPFDAVEVRQVAVALTEKWNLARQAQLKMHQVETIVQARTHDLEIARVALATARDAAEAANRAKSAFLANMSHELRTPLTAILGFAENLLDAQVPETDRRSAAETILRNGEHLLSLLNDILDVSKIEAGKFVTERVVCEPAAIVRETCELMRAQAEKRGLAIEMECGDSVPTHVISDPTRLRQILDNLAGNAVKFTSAGSVCIALGFEPVGENDGRLSFDITDTGIGMTTQQADDLFQPFHQADVTTTRRYGGTGLGLYISRRLAELLGGDVEIVETEPGRGTRLRVTVNVDVADAAQKMTASNRETRRPSNPLEGVQDSPPRFTGRVLVVEDGVDNQRLIDAFLCRAGAEVAIAENGRIGLERALEAWESGEPFDVILMDMQMPEMDGYEATRQLRACGYPGLIIALTAHAMSGDGRKCIEAGCDDYASKPIRRDELIRKISGKIEACQASG